MEEHCLLTHFLAHLASFLLQSKTACLGTVPPMVGWVGPVALISNQSNPPLTCPQDSLICQFLN